MQDMEDGFLTFCWQNLAPEARARILSQSAQDILGFLALAPHITMISTLSACLSRLLVVFFKPTTICPSPRGLTLTSGHFLNNFLQEYRGVTPETIAQFDENIEAFMTSVEGELERIREAAKDHKLSGDEYAHAIPYAMVFTNMNFIFANVLNEAQNGASMSLYRALLEFAAQTICL